MRATSIEELNPIYRDFWQDQTARLHRRLSVQSICEQAMARIELQQSMSVPVAARTTLEYELEWAEKSQSTALTEQARKGGKAPKEDALQQLIIEIVADLPQISAGQLVQRLKQSEWGGVVVEVTSELITFVNYSDGTTKDAKVSGLKHRLTRAREKIRELRTSR